MSTTDMIVNPRTGEALTLESPTPDLAAFIADVREAEGELREVKRMVTRELLSRMDREASWTHRTATGLKLTGSSPAPVEEWDGPQLREALLLLVDAGALSIEAVDKAVETVVSYKPRKAGISALRKLGGEVAETIDSLARPVEKERYVTVSRA